MEREAIERHRCFVSYCHEGMDRETLDYLTHVLRDALASTAELLIDVHLPVGGNLDEFMALLDSIDAVVVILTPAYRRRVLERQGGVYNEYTRIIQRYESRGPRGSVDHFVLLPILFSGTFDTSTPDELRSLKSLDLTGLRVNRKPTGEFNLSSGQIRRYEPEIRNVATQVQASVAMGSSVFRGLSGDWFEKLFVDLKAHFDEPAGPDRDQLERIWVKTHAYQRISSQLAYMVVGRKGSGKSTMAQVLPWIEPSRYLGHVQIQAEEFVLETLYGFYGESRFHSDVTHAVSRDRAFQFAWEAVLLLGAMEEVVKLADAGCLSEVQLELLAPIRTFMSGLKGSRTDDEGLDWDYGDFFTFAFEATMRYLDHCIARARNDPKLFLTDVRVSFKRRPFLNSVFGREVVSAFGSLCRTFTRKLLVTFDGFDRWFDQFRQDSLRTGDLEETQRRAAFEASWLAALLALIRDAKRDERSFSFFSVLDFCIAVPKDRFAEVRRMDRDAYRYWHRWCSLNWSGIELAILLRKRIEALTGNETKPALSPRARLEQALTWKPFARLPRDLVFDYNDKHVTMPLFLYVLRHTFFRPRDVLMYYADLLALSEQLGRWGTELTTEHARECVKATSKRIIEEEFLSEFESTTGNIRAVLSLFRRAPITMDWQDLWNRLDSADFRFAVDGRDTRTMAGKIAFLYDIGFLGIQTSPELREEMGLGIEHVFVFNEPTKPIEEADQAEYESWRFVIHPLFRRYLRLDTRAQDLVLQYTWDYLAEGDAELAANPHTW